MSDVVTIADADGIVRYVSPSLERALGWRPDEWEGRPAIEAVHPDDADDARRAHELCLGSPGEVSPLLEVRLRHRDGSWRHFEAAGRGLHDSAGRVSVLVSCRDISERKQAERQLRNQMAFMDAVTSSLPGMFIVTDRDGRLVRWNQVLADYTGLSPRELADTHGDQVIHPEDRDAVHAAVEEALGHGWGRAEARILHRDGTQRHVLLHGGRVDIGDERYFVGTGFDISDRKHAEEQLAVLAAAVEQSADDIVVLDSRGAITYVNRAFERTTGFSRDEVVGSPYSVIQSGEYGSDTYGEILESLAARRVWTGRLSNRTRDGGIVQLQVTLSTILDAAGAVLGYISSRHDITRQLEAEERASRAEKLEAIGTLAGGIAHDFNNILSAIVGYAQLAQMKCAPDSALAHDLEAILQSSTRATELVRQILTFSRQERGEEQPVQVQMIVKEAVRFLRASIPSTVEFRLDLASEAVVMADPTEIHRIVVNLATNAARAMRDQGGVLEVSLAEMDLEASSALLEEGMAPGRHLRLRVRDTGHGMSREIMLHIFEPFFTTQSEGEGTGMGLSVVHGIVKRCRGAIAVASAPGEGATFDVYLPVIDLQAPAEAPPPSPLQRGHERVLFVDDEALVSEIVVEVLGTIGYQVKARSNGVEALALFESDPSAVDLVITDMTMPGMTGDVLAQRIKGIRPDLPIILCTGYSENITPERAAALGIDEFVMKPVLMPDLTRMIRRLLDRR